jgi:hypothetical protein
MGNWWSEMCSQWNQFEKEIFIVALSCATEPRIQCFRSHLLAVQNPIVTIPTHLPITSSKHFLLLLHSNPKHIIKGRHSRRIPSRQLSNQCLRSKTLHLPRRSLCHITNINSWLQIASVMIFGFKASCCPLAIFGSVGRKIPSVAERP